MKKTHSEAFNAAAAETPARVKKKIAVLSRIPRSPSEIGSIAALMKSMFEVHRADILRDTGAKARTKK